jgi:hypothetical protein
VLGKNEILVNPSLLIFNYCQLITDIKHATQNQKKKSGQKNTPENQEKNQDHLAKNSALDTASFFIHAHLIQPGSHLLYNFPATSLKTFIFVEWFRVVIKSWLTIFSRYKIKFDDLYSSTRYRIVKLSYRYC